MSIATVAIIITTARPASTSTSAPIGVGVIATTITGITIVIIITAITVIDEVTEEGDALKTSSVTFARLIDRAAPCVRGAVYLRCNAGTRCFVISW